MDRTEADQWECGATGEYICAVCRAVFLFTLGSHLHAGVFGGMWDGGFRRRRGCWLESVRCSSSASSHHRHLHPTASPCPCYARHIYI